MNFKGFQNTIRAYEESDVVAGVQRYLQKYGYLNAGFKLELLDDPTQEALREFQRRRQIQENGEINIDTIRKMMEPRCGMKDIAQRLLDIGDNDGSASSGCSYKGFKKLTYGFRNFDAGTHLDEELIKSIISEAFLKWEAIIEIPFVGPSPVTASDFSIGWYKRMHKINDIPCNNFDNTGGDIGHAFPPAPCSPKLAGECHFDADESWEAITSGGVLNLNIVALHEIGHLLGLVGHSDTIGDVMHSDYQFMGANLKPNDKAWIRKLYKMD
jgi:hypothetical protein